MSRPTVADIKEDEDMEDAQNQELMSKSQSLETCLVTLKGIMYLFHFNSQASSITSDLVRCLLALLRFCLRPWRVALKALRVFKLNT